MENNSGDENSDNGLQIVIELPRPKKRSKKELDDSDKKIIESVEQDIEDNLEEKAAKTNLTAKHVKNILKEVVTNEHVLALVRQAENPDNSHESLPAYEPKYTRAKTKELLSTSTPQKIMPWMSPPRVSEVQMLFTEELQEDSSGDEYVPKSSNKNSSFDTTLDTSSCTIKNDEANIALRTRSKFSLSHTPLEVIEEAFMPPDITTDMYDMDCDDDVWKDFLKTFTRPLDEVTKAAEDEDHDPEYNVLADEEIDEIDREELRADRAVTVSRKEFNCLMAELFEFADIYESNRLTEKNDVYNNLSVEQPQQIGNDNDAGSDLENDPNISIKKCQIPILAQQMRQHVQMLTQNFLLSYGNPEYYDQAEQYKEMLDDIVSGAEGKDASIYYATNLQPATKLIEDWEELYSSRDEEVIECKRHIEKVLVESKDAKLAGREYIVTFPELLMKTIANSEVFMYPNLLPRIPFRSFHVTRCPYKFFTNGEENLIALFLEQIIPILKQDSFYITPQKNLHMLKVCELLNCLLIPDVTPKNILRRIKKRKHPNCEENPIKFYYRTRRAPPTVHYVVPMDVKDVLPPCKRRPESLPHQWREYIYPNEKDETNGMFDTNAKNKIVLVSYPDQLRPAMNISRLTPLIPYNVNLSQRGVGNRKIQPKTPLLPEIFIPRKRKRTPGKKRKAYKSTGNTKGPTKISPDMPSLGNTLDKVENAKVQEVNENDRSSETNNKELNLSFKNITNQSLEFQFNKPNAVTQAKRNFESISKFSITSNRESGSSDSTSTEKGNSDDTPELTSSLVKDVATKEPSRTESTRPKIRREFLENLVVVSSDDLEAEGEKEDNFVDTLFDKLRQTLTVEEYDKLIDILDQHDQTNGEFLELFKNVQSILFPTYKDLYEEFFLFLTYIQAHKVGQLMPYFVMKDMDRFMKKLHVYFKNQPTQLRNILKCLSESSENCDNTMETVKTTVLPLLKGNVALTDWCLQIFPKLIVTDSHIIEPSKELSRVPGEDICEAVALPDIDDLCVEHSEKVHFEQSSATQGERSDTIPNKSHVSQNKENNTQEEILYSHENKDDESNRLKTQRKQQRVKDPDKSKVKEWEKTHSNLKIAKNSPKQQRSKRKTTKNTRPAKELEVKCSEPAETVQLKVNSDQSAEFRSVISESSQHIIQEDSVEPPCVSTPQLSEHSKDLSWSREEDKIILHAFQQSGDNEETCKRITELLEHRSALAVKNRFHKLMILLQQMASK